MAKQARPGKPAGPGSLREANRAGDRKTGAEHRGSAQNPQPSAAPASFRYLAFCKPYGVLTQFTDGSGRATLKDYVPVPGVYSAGRLDADSEGLLILTDDGALAHRLTDPRFGHPRVYLAQVERLPEPAALEALRSGVMLADGPTRPAEVALLAEPPALPERPVPIRFRKNVLTAWLRLVLREGRNRQVRRMTAAVGHPTLRLVRTAIGPVTLGGLQPGQWRELSAAEVAQLAAGEITRKRTRHASPKQRTKSPASGARRRDVN